MKPATQAQRQNKKKTPAQKVGAMWGHPIEYWQQIAAWILFAAFGFGGLGVTASFLSSWLAGKAADAIQQEANVRIAEAAETAAQANSRAATANEHARQLEKDAAQIRLEYERLKRQVSWRELTPAQHAALVDTLRGHGISITLTWCTGDHEAETYARQIESALRDAGVSLEIVGCLSITRVPSGIALFLPYGPRAELLASAFRAAGIAFTNEGKNPLFELFIGRKPHSR